METIFRRTSMTSLAKVPYFCPTPEDSFRMAAFSFMATAASHTQQLHTHSSSFSSSPSISTGREEEGPASSKNSLLQRDQDIIILSPLRAFTSSSFSCVKLRKKEQWADAHVTYCMYVLSLLKFSTFPAKEKLCCCCSNTSLVSYSYTDTCTVLLA